MRFRVALTPARGSGPGQPWTSTARVRRDAPDREPSKSMARPSRVGAAPSPEGPTPGSSQVQARGKRRRRVSALHGDGSTRPSRRPSARRGGFASSVGWGLALAGGLPPITLYPVGALAPVHNPACTDREAWDGPDQSLPRGFCSQGQDRARGGHGSHPGRGERPFEGSLAVRSVQARFKTAPSGMTPVSRQRHSATASLRAMATMAMRRRRPFRSPTRSRNHLESALSGW